MPLSKPLLSQHWRPLHRAGLVTLVGSSQCSLGLGGRQGCTPAVGVGGASFPDLTLQFIPGASPR